MEHHQKTKNRVATSSSYPTPGPLSKTTIQIDTCTPAFIAALLTIAKTWKQHKCPLTDEWIKKMWSLYTMEYYSAIKKEQQGKKNFNEIMPFAVTWMDLEITTISKEKYHTISKTNTIWYQLHVESKI